jgi:hypothetical protein
LKETEQGRQKYETGNELTDFQKPDQMEAVENSGSSGKTEVRKEEQPNQKFGKFRLVYQQNDQFAMMNLTEEADVKKMEPEKKSDSEMEPEPTRPCSF